MLKKAIERVEEEKRQYDVANQLMEKMDSIDERRDTKVVELFEELEQGLEGVKEVR